MIGQFISMFSYQFMVRAIIVGCLMSLCASLLGVSLVLKRYSMIGDGLSHVGFGALAMAAVLNLAPLAVAIPVVILAAFGLMSLSRNSKIKGDALIGLISSGALAIGVMAVSMKKGVNIDLNSYLFGSILSLNTSDMIWSVLLSVAVLVCYILLYPRMFAVTFDDTFARATGTNSDAFNTILAVLTAITIVLGMRMMGALLISSLIIFPGLTSMRVFKSFSKVVIGAAVVSVVCCFIGIFLSFSIGCPTGAVIVCVNMVVFALAAGAGAIRNRIARG